MLTRISVSAFCALLLASSGACGATAAPPLRDMKIISSAGARGMVDVCTAWAEKKNVGLAMVVLDWGGNVIESHAMEGATPNAIDTALLKARNALRWRRPSSETAMTLNNGGNQAPRYIAGDFPIPGALPVIVDGQLVGAMGVSSPDGEKCAAAGIEAVFGKAAKLPAPTP